MTGARVSSYGGRPLDPRPETVLMNDWNPRSESVLADPLGACDAMRPCCPVAHSDYLGWSLFKHADVMRVLNDPATFSSAVSAHLSVPSGIDPPAHTGYRRLLDPYFAPQEMTTFEPICTGIARRLMHRLEGTVEIMEAVAHPFALEVQCAFMGWPDELQEALRSWIRRNHRATLSGDRATLNAVAAEFQALVDGLIAERERDPRDDVTARLARETLDGLKLSVPELTSIIRNWTVGELGTIAASVGILVRGLARDPELQARLRGDPTLLPTAIDEILRVHGPLLTNRRKATRDVEIGSRLIRAGDRVTLMWTSANRDEEAFHEPTEVRLDRQDGPNLLFGAGIHVCPGAPLARLELRVLMEALLDELPGWKVLEERLARYPTGGYDRLVVRFSREGS